MDPISHRLSLVESRLKSLTQCAKDLTVELREIRKLAEEPEPAEDEFFEPVIPPITPPPLPDELSESPPFTAEPLLELQIPAELTQAPQKTDHAALEMQLGRVWFVRLGIILLTTGLVFLSRYTYDNFVRDLGPGIRLTLLYLFSFTLAGAGLFFEQWKDSLKSYGRIVAAGGFAAVYYASFAAHNVDALRVIESPVLASLLLTASAGLFCVISLRRESRVMLATSLGLAFYSISVNPIGWMACLSAMVLATLGVVMMIRYRWTEIGFVVLIGSYASYFWWQIATGAQSGSSHWFLPAYWTLFGAASLFATKDLSEKRHALFTSINHAALFLLFPLNLHTGKLIPEFWLFTLVLGTAILTLGLLARRNFPQRSTILHLAKGVGLITLGLSLKLSGYQLFVSLLIEGLILMVVHLKYPHPYTRGASWLISGLSLLALVGVNHADLHPGLWLIGTAGWLTLAWLERAAESTSEIPLPHLPAMGASLVSGAILIVGFMGNWTADQAVTTLVILGLITSALHFSAPLKKRAFDSLWIFALIGLFAPLGLLDPPQQSSQLLLLLSLLALTGTALHFYLATRNQEKVELISHQIFEGFHLASSIALMICAISFSDLLPSAKMLLPLFIPIAGTLVAIRTKSIRHSAIPFLAYFAIPETIVWSGLPLFLAFTLCLGHLLLVRFKDNLSDRIILEPALFLLTLFFWGTSIITGLENPALILTWTSVAILLLAPWQGKALTACCAAPFFLGGLAWALLSGDSPQVYASLLAPIALHLWKTSRKKESKHPFIAIISLLVVWGQLTRDTGQDNPAALWAILGTILLLTGLPTKSRCFRLMALVILALSLGHLMIFDIVKLEPLPRILSFMTLGFGLLGLGFVYNRWQDRLKQIL
ncbi:DUF2339 domain-containing protein [Verrucomicrobiaceae bacterium 227]